MRALEAFADTHKETQGQFTIGDEKKHNVFMRPDVCFCNKPSWGC